MKLRYLPLLMIVVVAYSAALIISTAAVTLAFRPKPIFKIAPVPTATPDDGPSPRSFDPGYYGLPNRIAGYKIIAVETSANMACMTPGDIKLVLQSSQPSVDAFLKNAPGDGLEEEVAKLSIKPKQWEFEYVGTGITRETVLSVAKQWNAFNHGMCLILGGPIPTSVPASP